MHTYKQIHVHIRLCLCVYISHGGEDYESTTAQPSQVIWNSLPSV